MTSTGRPDAGMPPATLSGGSSSGLTPTWEERRAALKTLPQLIRLVWETHRAVLVGNRLALGHRSIRNADALRVDLR